MPVSSLTDALPPVAAPLPAVPVVVVVAVGRPHYDRGGPWRGGVNHRVVRRDHAAGEHEEDEDAGQDDQDGFHQPINAARGSAVLAILLRGVTCLAYEAHPGGD